MLLFAHGSKHPLSAHTLLGRTSDAMSIHDEVKEAEDAAAAIASMATEMLDRATQAQQAARDIDGTSSAGPCSSEYGTHSPVSEKQAEDGDDLFGEVGVANPEA